MCHRLFFILTLLLGISVSSCTNEDDDGSGEVPVPSVRSLSADEADVASSANNFTLNLMAELDEELPNENYFISSFSISTALSMVMNGASEDSQQGFIQAMDLTGMSPDAINTSYQSLVEYVYSLDPSITLSIANSNWYSNEYAINGDFASTLSEYYDAEIFARDFGNSSTLDELNGWVEQETNGKIKNVLDRINPADVMFLINAIYFKADWTSQFDPGATQDRPFLLANGQSVDVPTMTAEVKHWMAYDEALNAQIIEIPYGNEAYAFTIIMPDEASDIDNLSSSIEVNRLNSVLADSATFERELYLPKFQLDFKADLKDILVGMGMPLTGLDNLFEEDLALAISKVIHQSFLEVNEEGSEAAAVTVIGVELTSLPAATQVNQPFIFLIRERNSDTILFSGKLLDPRSSN